MAELGKIASMSQKCEQGSSPNTGDGGCGIEFGKTNQVHLTKPNYEIPSTTEVDKAYFQKEVQKGNIIPLTNAYGAEIEISDDTLETSGEGIESLVRKGLIKVKLTFKKGSYFAKQVEKLTSFGKFNAILGDVSDNWKYAKSSNGNFKGFTVGQITTKQMPATDSEAEKVQVSFQLIKEREFNRDYEIMEAGKLFPFSELEGVNGIQLTTEDANGDVVPASGDTTIKVKAVFADGKSLPLEGLTEPNFRVNGVAPTGINHDGGAFYTLTVPALTAGTTTVELYDATEKVNVINLLGVLYRSNRLSKTVA